MIFDSLILFYICTTQNTSIISVKAFIVTLFIKVVRKG